MKFFADIDVMPLDELLDPQGKAVIAGLHHLELKGIADARLGKHIRLEIEAEDESEAEQKVKRACEQLLANPVVEQFKYNIQAAQ